MAELILSRIQDYHQKKEKIVFFNKASYQVNHPEENAKILNFVNEMKNGVNSFIGEKGIQLSGGQKQRIAIARELYRKPEILILDEATSGLDEKTENQFLEFLEILKKKLTIIIVSHRKNTLKNCDKIIQI